MVWSLQGDHEALPGVEVFQFVMVERSKVASAYWGSTGIALTITIITMVENNTLKGVT
jgi:hypothetical protein